MLLGQMIHMEPHIGWCKHPHAAVNIRIYISNNVKQCFRSIFNSFQDTGFSTPTIPENNDNNPYGRWLWLKIPTVTSNLFSQRKEVIDG